MSLVFQWPIFITISGSHPVSMATVAPVGQYNGVVQYGGNCRSRDGLVGGSQCDENWRLRHRPMIGSAVNVALYSADWVQLSIPVWWEDLLKPRIGNIILGAEESDLQRAVLAEEQLVCGKDHGGSSAGLSTFGAMSEGRSIAVMASRHMTLSRSSFSGRSGLSGHAWKSSTNGCTGITEERLRPSWEPPFTSAVLRWRMSEVWVRLSIATPLKRPIMVASAFC